MIRIQDMALFQRGRVCLNDYNVHVHVYHYIPTKSLYQLREREWEGEREKERGEGGYLTIWSKPHDAAACNGVHPSLSVALMLAPYRTSNFNISTSSSIQH